MLYNKKSIFNYKYIFKKKTERIEINIIGSQTLSKKLVWQIAVRFVILTPRTSYFKKRNSFNITTMF